MSYKEAWSQGYETGYTDGLAAGEAAVRDDVKDMLQIVKEESSCAELKDGAAVTRSS